jgi:futalosine hydrolase
VTVSTITATERGAVRHYKRFKPCLENMEGVGAAFVAKHYGIPFLEIRCVSNLVGKRNRDAWDLPLACRRSAEAAVLWMETVSCEQ